ncbi:hypothetical protein D092_20690 [Rhodococcus ruber Chol-4]|nr:hypothetical protein D092_20690 [Rhodococcus ruber Chol-4]
MDLAAPATAPPRGRRNGSPGPGGWRACRPAPSTRFTVRALGEPAAERGRRDDELEDLHRRLLPSIQDPSRRGSLQAAVG